MAKHKLDKIFADGLQEFTAAPAPSAWDQIEESLQRKQKGAFWAWAGIAASAALLLGSSWLMFQSPDRSTSDLYEYAKETVDDTALPPDVVYVPIYIHTIIERSETPEQKMAKAVQPTQNKPAVVIVAEETALAANEQEVLLEEPEIVTIEDVPELATEDILLASAEMPIESATNKIQQPVTIIYKQGEPAKESNFTKALNYMEEVRMGEKKLVNFDKLRENFRSKFRSEEGVDTK